MVQKLSAFILYGILKWRIEGEIPWNERRLMLVFLPHTSNWDFVIACLFIKAERIKIIIFGKNAFYFFPFTYCYHYLGVVPIRRDKRSDFVRQAVALFQNDQALWVAMAPEGSRSHQTELKSGYYYLAKQSGIPLCLVGPNFQNKTLTLVPPRTVKSSFEKDSADLIKFSKRMTGKRPELSI